MARERDDEQSLARRTRSLSTELCDDLVFFRRRDGGAGGLELAELLA